MKTEKIIETCTTRWTHSGRQTKENGEVGEMIAGTRHSWTVDGHHLTTFCRPLTSEWQTTHLSSLHLLHLYHQNQLRRRI